MLNSRGDSAHRVVVVLLLAMNVLMFSSWSLLRALPTGSDGTLGTLIDDQGVLKARPRILLGNEDYLEAFLGAIHDERSILCLGTSETTFPFNIGAQLNSIASDDPSMVVVAMGGLSPIHRTLVFSRLTRDEVDLPPTLLIVNPVYFTHSHDVINDGWLSVAVRSPVFVQMDHRGLRAHLSDKVKSIYDDHYASKLSLTPMWMQQYLGDLLYLYCHNDSSQLPEIKGIRKPVFEFDGVLPEYDRTQVIHKDVIVTDRLAKGRWLVKSADESINLAATLNSLSQLRQQSAPVCVVFVPMNRSFYAANGLDMTEFDGRFRAIREAIRDAAEKADVYWMDLYDEPQLDMGFVDRMHCDAYGNNQIVRYMKQSPIYVSFLQAVRAYYDSASVTQQ